MFTYVLAREWCCTDVNAWSGLLAIVTTKTYVQTHFRTSTTTISGNHVGRTTVQFFLAQPCYQVSSTR